MPLKDEVRVYLLRFEEKRLDKPGACRICRSTGHLHWHGAYRRSLITFQDTVSIPIRRLFCTACRRTFALIPDFIVKFHRYAKVVIDLALQKLHSLSYDAVADLLMARCHRYVAIFTLHLWRRRFQTA